MLTVVEVDAHRPVRAVHELDGPVEARQHGVEAPGLERRLAGQLRAGDAGGKAEVVLDPGAGARLSARRPRLGHKGPQPLRRAVDGGRQAGRTGAQHHEVERLPVDLGAQAERARHLGGRRVAEHTVDPNQDRRLGARDGKRLQQRRTLGVGVDVVPAHRQQVPLEQVADLEGATRAARRDQAQHAHLVPLEPGPPRRHRLQDELAELGQLGQHRAQLGPLERDHAGRLDGDPGRDRRLAGEHGDVPDERAAVHPREPHVFLQAAVDDVDNAVLDDEERRIADALLEQQLVRLEGPPLPALGQLLDLGVRQPREQDRIAELGEELGLDAFPRHPTPAAVSAPGGDRVDEPPGLLDRLARLGQERPEELEGVRLDRVELEPRLDAVCAGAFGELMGVLAHRVGGRALDQHRRQPGEILLERVQQRLVDRAVPEVARGEREHHARQRLGERIGAPRRSAACSP